MKKNNNDLFDIPQDAFQEVSDAARILRSFVSQVDETSIDKKNEKPLFTTQDDLDAINASPQDDEEHDEEHDEIEKVNQLLAGASFLSENLDTSVSLTEKNVQRPPSSIVEHKKLKPLLNPPPSDLATSSKDLFYKLDSEPLDEEASAILEMSPNEDTEEKSSHLSDSLGLWEKSSSEEPKKDESEYSEFAENNAPVNYNPLATEMLSIHEPEDLTRTIPNMESVQLLETKTKDTIQEVPFDETAFQSDDEPDDNINESVELSNLTHETNQSIKADYPFMDSDLPSLDSFESLANGLDEAIGGLPLGHSAITDLLPKSVTLNLPSDSKENLSIPSSEKATLDLNVKSSEESVVLSDAPGFVGSLDQDEQSFLSDALTALNNESTEDTLIDGDMSIQDGGLQMLNISHSLTQEPTPSDDNEVNTADTAPLKALSLPLATIDTTPFTGLEPTTENFPTTETNTLDLLS